MEDLGCPRRHRPVRWMIAMLAASCLCCPGEPLAITPRWQVVFPAQPNGRAAQSTMVPIDGNTLLVAVVAAGVNPQKHQVRVGNQSVAAQIVGLDAVSRLAFIKIGGANLPKPAVWLNDASGSIGVPLRAQTSGGFVKCRATGWVKQLGPKILPLALLNVNFDRNVPPPGTPLLDESGRIAALVFQAAGNGAVGYAIPAEAVHRVRRDLDRDGGNLVRGWIGLALNAENQSPRVLRVLAGSPAAKVGIHQSDVLLAIGTRRISDYADAVNAFFYLIPDEPVSVKILRGADPMEFTVTPTRQPAG